MRYEEHVEIIHHLQLILSIQLKRLKSVYAAGPGDQSPIKMAISDDNSQLSKSSRNHRHAAVLFQFELIMQCGIRSTSVR